MIAVSRLIHAIELIQPVTNKAVLDECALAKSVHQVATFELADADAVVFLSDKKYLDQLASTRAGVILISQRFFADETLDLTDRLPKKAIILVVKDAYLAYASISTLFERGNGDMIGDTQAIHPTAIVHASASIGQGVRIGAYAVIGAGVVIGDGVVVMSHVHISDDVTIGADAWIGAHVFIGHGTQIGQRTRIHAQASIASDGFGFASRMVDGVVAWQRIAQLGHVIIGDDVRIGAQTCIDRGAVANTVIGNHVIIDNLVQIAHNVEIQEGTAIAANTGIAGSTRIGKNCVIAGAVGISGHLTIGDGVTFTGMSMVTKSIREAGVYSSGTPAMPSANWRRAALKFRQMGEK